FAIPSSATKLKLETKLTINVNDGNTVIPPIDFRNNDTIRQVTILDNYYAYDDGEAEYVAGVNQRLGKIAVRYVIPQEAQLSDIDICFVPFVKDLSNQSFVLSVWKKIGGRSQELLFQKAFPVKYPNKPNGFVRFNIDTFRTLIVKDTIFVGIQQTNDDLLAIGFDANNHSFDEVFYNVSGIWEQENNIKGSLMIRPVFRSNAITALSENPTNPILIFPNPAQNYAEIRGIIPQAIELYDLQARRQNFIWDKNNNRLNFNLPKGLYLLKIQDFSGKWWHEKLVISQ
ncbi:MAG: T9SS type A sorting domain-containing protein, partial [Raineya sp.]|nr:T9SS type A sorting domain-containing protein [Raineya sp.]